MSAVVPDPAATPPQTARVANIANALTLLRLLLVPVFGWALLQEDGTSTGWRVTAFVVFAVASITDRLDGDLARRRGWPGSPRAGSPRSAAVSPRPRGPG